MKRADSTHWRSTGERGIHALVPGTTPQPRLHVEAGMVMDYFDRDGKPMPDDWHDTKVHGRKYSDSYHTGKRVARTVVGEITVSTVWLGLDHDFNTGVPIIFETMTFGDPWNNEMERYSTEEDAIRGHLRVLDRLRAGKPPFAYLDEENDDA